MATSEGASSLPHENIYISMPGDLTVEVIEHERTRTIEIDPDTLEERLTTTSVPKAAASIRVSKAKLLKACPYFRAMLSGSWDEKNSKTISLEEDQIRSIEVWLRLFHSTLTSMSHDIVSIPDVWHVIIVGDKYEFGLKHRDIKRWFSAWFTAKQDTILADTKLGRQMLFPSYTFDDAKAFLRVTKYIVYEYPSHIMEDNPTVCLQMRLPSRVTQQLNAARGRLRNILHRGLFTKIKDILETATCKCKENTVFDYLRELQRIDVWPFLDAFSKTSVQEVLDRMEDFDSTNMRPVSVSSGTNTDSSPKNKPCVGRGCSYGFCNVDWDDIVISARQETLRYFDGLCLDCMDRSKNIRVGGDNDDDYWEHGRMRPRHDTQCRVSHGEPTWYYSFMGRREKSHFH